MPRYLETAAKLNERVEDLFAFVESTHPVDGPYEDQLAIMLAHIVNLSVRCNPRQSQGVVRKIIVEIAMGARCNVSMTRETDADTGREFNQIHIAA